MYLLLLCWCQPATRQCAIVCNEESRWTGKAENNNSNPWFRFKGHLTPSPPICTRPRTYAHTHARTHAHIALLASASMFFSLFSPSMSWSLGSSRSTNSYCLQRKIWQNRRHLIKPFSMRLNSFKRWKSERAQHWQHTHFFFTLAWSKACANSVLLCWTVYVLRYYHCLLSLFFSFFFVTCCSLPADGAQRIFFLIFDVC